MLNDRLFPLASTDTILLVLRPEEHGYWALTTHQGVNPLQDEDPARYDRLTAAEVIDVVDAVLVDHLGL